MQRVADRRLPRSTSTNSGRSFGRQVISSSFITWLTTPPWSFTPGEISALTKCSGTFMWIFLFVSTRWKSTCSDLRPERVHLVVAQQHLRLLAADFDVEDRGVEALVPQLEPQVLVVELDVDRRPCSPPYRMPGTRPAAQAAARTRALNFALAATISIAMVLILRSEGYSTNSELTDSSL